MIKMYTVVYFLSPHIPFPSPFSLPLIFPSAWSSLLASVFFPLSLLHFSIPLSISSRILLLLLFLSSLLRSSPPFSPSSLSFSSFSSSSPFPPILFLSFIYPKYDNKLLSLSIVAGKTRQVSENNEKKIDSRK